jgi:hypothetical protein
MTAPTPRYASIVDWRVISGMGRSATYLALGRGDLRAVKFGHRTLIDVEHGLAWVASLPPAKITTADRRLPKRELGGLADEPNSVALPSTSTCFPFRRRRALAK